MDDKNLSMNIIEMRSVYRNKLDLSIDECDFIYKIILKELCDINPIKIALDPTFNLSLELENTLLQSMNMDAVLDYEKHNYIFFVADPYNRGYHLFARNLSEHNRNKRVYTRWLNSRGIFR
jgi:hypothetical protein